MADPVTATFLVAALAGGGVAAVGARNAGISQNIQAKEQAKQIQLEAKDREIERRRTLIEAISTQNAEAGAGGDEISTGSRRAIVLEDIRRQRLDDLTDRAMTNRRALTLRAGGRAAQRAGNLQAVGTLLTTAGTFGGDTKTAITGNKSGGKK